MSVLASCDVCSQQQWDAHQLMVSRGSLLQRSHSGATNVMPNSRLAHSGGNGRSSAQGHLQNLSEKQGKNKWWLQAKLHATMARQILAAV